MSGLHLAVVVLFPVAGCAAGVGQTRPETCDAVENVLAVTPLKVAAPGFPAHVPHFTLAGAVIAVRAIDGLSADRLQHLVDCHLPLGVETRVKADGARFLVEVRAAGSTSAREVLARARLLTSGATP